MSDTLISRVKFNENGLVPAVARDARTGLVLMLAWQNAEAFRLTLATGWAHYYSRSRKALWKKGETSGNLQKVAEVRLDCDGDAVLLIVDQTGPACHTGAATCFFQTEAADSDQPLPLSGALTRLHDTIVSRMGEGGAKSYVKSLFEKGPEAIFAKVAEESGELIDASRRDLPRGELVHEAADLWFHSLVLLARHGIHPDEIFTELDRRAGRSGLDEKAARPPKGPPAK